jgi:hypothetical protein
MKSRELICFNYRKLGSLPAAVSSVRQPSSREHNDDTHEERSNEDADRHFRGTVATIGAIGVRGASGGQFDESCAMKALEIHAKHLK